MVFTNRIRLLLKAQHKTAKQMLSDLEINKDQLKIWEEKGVIPKQIYVAAIADYLGTTPEYLKGETDVKQNPSADKHPDSLVSEIVKNVVTLSDEDKQKVLEYAELLSKK